MTARHHYSLSDIELSGGVQVFEAQNDISVVAFGRLGAPERAFRHKDIRRNLMSAHQTQAFILEYFTHAGEEMIVPATISRHHTRQHAEPFDVQMHLPQ